MHLAFFPNLHKHICIVFNFSRDKCNPGEVESKSYAKLLGQTRCVMGDVQIANLIVQLTDLL